MRDKEKNIKIRTVKKMLILRDSMKHLNDVWEQTDKISGSKNYPFNDSYEEYFCEFSWAFNEYLKDIGYSYMWKPSIENPYSTDFRYIQRNFINVIYAIIKAAKSIQDDEECRNDINKYLQNHNLLQSKTIEEFLDKMKLWFEFQCLEFGTNQQKTIYEKTFNKKIT